MFIALTPDDSSDGRVEDGEDDADGDDDHVDAGDVEHLLVRAADQKQESLKSVAKKSIGSQFYSF